jgi:Tol biopolymer transport system component
MKTLSNMARALSLFSAGICSASAMAEGQAIDPACQNCTSPKRVLPAGRIERISVDSNGQQANGRSFSPGLSADGRFVVFVSEASNLVDGDANNVADIFVRDRETARTERVSIGSAGEEANGGSDSPSISADGRYVAFYSEASNLVADDTNRLGDMFVHDRQTGITQRVSLLPDGSQALPGSIPGSDNDFLVGGPMTGDGNSVVFAVYDHNLSNLLELSLSLAPVYHPNYFIHNRQTGLTESLDILANWSTRFGGISSDGRYAAYSTSDSEVPNDTNNLPDAYLYDRHTGAKERMSLTFDGKEAMECGGSGFIPFPGMFLNGITKTAVSADGTHVAFDAYSANLVSADSNGYRDVFVRNRADGTLRRVSVAANHAQAENGDSILEGLSGDGRFVAFSSLASNLVPNDRNNAADVFIHDQQTHNTWSVSLAGDGATANGKSEASALSNDGRVIAFVSEAKNLIIRDTNETADIFAAEMPKTPPNPYRPGNLSVSEKTPDLIGRVGQPLRYTLTAHNRGRTKVSKVVLNHYFSDEVDILSLPKRCRKVDLPSSFPELCGPPKSMLRCTMGLLKAKQKKQAKLVIRPKAAGTLIGTTEVFGNVNDSHLNDNTASLVKTIAP